MLKRAFTKLWDACRSDPRFVAKFVIITITLGAIGKAMFVGAVDHADINPTYGQFVPTAPMMVMTFWSHKYLWGHRETKLVSHVGGHWSGNFWAQFAIGHGTLTILTIYSGLVTWQFVAVSTVLGVLFAVITFSWNEWKVFSEQKRLMKTATV